MKRYFGVSLLAATLLACTGQPAIAAGSINLNYQELQQLLISNVDTPTKINASFNNQDLHQMGLIRGSYFLDMMSDYDKKQAIDSDKIYATFVFAERWHPAVLIADFEAGNQNDIVACMDALRSTHFMDELHKIDDDPYSTQGKLEVQGNHLADIPISMISQNAYGPLYTTVRLTEP
jgi:hypothetical protein